MFYIANFESELIYCQVIIENYILKFTINTVIIVDAKCENPAVTITRQTLKLLEICTKKAVFRYISILLELEL